MIIEYSPLSNALRGNAYKVAIQTCGHFDWSLFQRNLLSGIDLIYFDLKCIDSYLHQQWTGRSNRRILDNFSRLVNAARHKVVCTIPLIPGYTAQKDNVHDLARFAGDMDVISFCLRPYNPGIWFKAREVFFIPTKA
ncbi:MAG: hypothetical protein R6U13_15020 [Desulfatiglandaceae bacterium]